MSIFSRMVVIYEQTRFLRNYTKSMVEMQRQQVTEYLLKFVNEQWEIFILRRVAELGKCSGYCGGGQRSEERT